MAYSAQVVRRARQRLADARAEKTSQHSQRQQIVYQEIPRVRQIDSILESSMALAVQAMFSGSPGAKENFEAVKRENLALQQEKTELINARFGANYLDETPICSFCGGEGYVGSQMCRCLQALCQQEQKKEISLFQCGEHTFDEFQLDYYPERTLPGSKLTFRTIMQKTYQDCISYSKDFDMNSRNLLFSGDTGLGKTFLSACIAREVSEKGYSVTYESAVHLFDKLEKAKFSGDQEAVTEAARYTQCDLLIVDDLGTEMVSQFVTTALYTLINDRLLSGKPTIISTNLTAEEMENRYSPQILSRLRGNYRRVAFVGDDIRILKKQGGTA